MIDKTSAYKYMVCVRCMTYNQVSYINDTLNGFSIQKVDFPVVFIIVDDASTDGEQEMLRKWVKDNLLLNEEYYRWEKRPFGDFISAPSIKNSNFEFVIILLNENHYQKKTSKLPYIMDWLDNAKYHALCEGDDYWIDPLKLSKQVEFLENNPDYGMVRTNINRLFQKDGVIENRFFDKMKIRDTYSDYVYNRWFAAPCTWLLRTTMYKGALEESRLIDKMGGFGGDLAIIIYFCENSNIKYLEDVTAMYRVQDSSVSHFNEKERRKVFYKKIKKTQRYYASKKSIFTRVHLEIILFYIDLRYHVGMMKRALVHKKGQ